MIKLGQPDIGKEEIEAVSRVLETGQLVMGDEVESFESLVKTYLGTKYCYAVSSGTAALHLALMAFDITIGDEVIVPSFTFPATANVVELVGANVKFVDVDIQNYCMDVSLIESAITHRTKAIIVVHEFGNAANMQSVKNLAHKYGLKIIEDAACALGTKIYDQFAGTFGDIGCFSLHPRKAITTGEGGIMVTDNAVLARKIELLRNHGMDKSSGSIRFVLPGLNYRMTNFQGAMAVVQFNKMENLISSRAHLAEIYMLKLSGHSHLQIPIVEDYIRHIWQTYHVVLNENIDRDQVIRELRVKKIESNYGANSVASEPYYLEKYGINVTPVADTLYRQGLALPLHSKLTDSEVMYVIDCLNECIQNQMIK